MDYYARSDSHDPVRLPREPGAHWQPLRRHLVHVAWLARRLARETTSQNLAFGQSATSVGLCHDLGKYRDEFQKMLFDVARGLPKHSAPHSVYGAALMLQYKSLETVLAALGHHAGLPSSSSIKIKIGHEERSIAQALADRQAMDFGVFRGLLTGKPPPTKVDRGQELTMELRVRMLMSCLVDADRLDAQRHGSGNLPEPKPLDPSRRLGRLLDYVQTCAARTPEGPVKEARRQVLRACCDAAEWPERLLSLTVPTGGGKTLASMAFALRRAVVRPDEVRRVIVVIPFLSIIEQNAKVLRDALGKDAVLEHHSGDFAGLKPLCFGNDYKFAPAPQRDDVRVQAETATENWDAPVVVTTSVRFFESLFSNHPSDLRRLHNIARSVVILDEVQTLPLQFMGAILSMMEGLARDWCTTFLFCTATQPAFEKLPTSPEDDIRWELGTVREIVPERNKLFEVLKRTRVEMLGSGEEMGWDEVAQRMANEVQALCVVNTKQHAADLYGELKRAAQQVGLPETCVLHLSTRMCARHRLDRLRAIREALHSGEPCLVASTQLVEAGVDLDFPVVFRAIGPMDSIAQAAGRCDREGRLTAAAGQPAGRVYVFEAPGKKTPPGVYKQATGLTRGRFSPTSASIHSPQHIQNYFQALYTGRDIDQHNINGLRRRLDFPEVARRFYMIDDRTRAVLVPYRRMGRVIIDCLRAGHSAERSFWHRAQQFQVGLYPGEFEAAQQAWTISQLSEEHDLWACAPECYSLETGLGIKPAVESNIV